MAVTFFIPRQFDQDLIRQLWNVRVALPEAIPLRLAVDVDHAGTFDLIDRTPEGTPQIQFALKLASTVIRRFHIKSRNHTALTVTRDLQKAWDSVQINDEWLDDTPAREARAENYATFVASARAELNAPDLEAALRGADNNDWNRYRNAQMAVINSLQQASESLLIKVADRNTQLDQQRSQRFEALEKDLRQQVSDERKKLQADYDLKEKDLSAREKQLTDRESNFNTKEAHLVSRKKQEEQIVQIKTWLEDWNLTKGTIDKRRNVYWSYILGLVLSGGLSVLATIHNYNILALESNISTLHWWHWIVLASKSVFPFAVFVTFMVYFIRWNSAWARQHADEEFINRSRLIDIGRSSWLLEAVRDANERSKEIPSDLLKELSRNLFTHVSKGDADVQPKSVADLLLQGLASLRVKSADGTEVEARRGK